MARRVVKSEAALDDIASIYWRGVELFGDKRAAQFHFELYERFDLLADQPELGPRRDWITPGLRLYFLPKPVVIAYRFNDQELHILRIFHGRQDYEELLQLE